MSRQHTATIYRENEDGTEYEVRVTFDMSPIRPAVYNLRNGDPGYPAEGGEVEVTSAVRQDTLEEVELTDDEIESISVDASDDDYEPDFEHGSDPDDERWLDAYDEPYCWEG